MHAVVDTTTLEVPHFFGRSLAILALVGLQWHSPKQSDDWSKGTSTGVDVLAFKPRASLAWYTLSYIPYGQRLATTVLKKCCGLSSDGLAEVPGQQQFYVSRDGS